MIKIMQVLKTFQKHYFVFILFKFVFNFFFGIYCSLEGQLFNLFTTRVIVFHIWKGDSSLMKKMTCVWDVKFARAKD